jgi:hypothetical protein
MMSDAWIGRWGFLMFVVTAVLRLPAQAQENILSNVVPTSGVILVKPAAQTGKGSALPNQGANAFLTLLLANTLKGTPQPPSTAIKPNSRPRISLSCSPFLYRKR